MDFILYRLACGTMEDADRARGNDIDCIVTLCEASKAWRNGIESLVGRHNHFYFHLPDDAPWHKAEIEDCIQWVSSVIAKRKRVLVHCHGGITRSPVMCAAYLISCGFSAGAALRYVVERRPQAKEMNRLVWYSIVEWAESL